jgi:hypothetical protein
MLADDTRFAPPSGGYPVPPQPVRPGAPAGAARKRGAPLGNTNALKHGFYARAFHDAEQSELAGLDPSSLENEIQLMRVFIRRTAIMADKVTDLDQCLMLLSVMSRASHSLASLMRTQQAAVSTQDHNDFKQLLADAKAAYASSGKLHVRLEMALIDLAHAWDKASQPFPDPAKSSDSEDEDEDEMDEDEMDEDEMDEDDMDEDDEEEEAEPQSTQNFAPPISAPPPSLGPPNSPSGARSARGARGAKDGGGREGVVSEEAELEDNDINDEAEADRHSLPEEKPPVHDDLGPRIHDPRHAPEGCYPSPPIACATCPDSKSVGCPTCPDYMKPPPPPHAPILRPLALRAPDGAGWTASHNIFGSD